MLSSNPRLLRRSRWRNLGVMLPVITNLGCGHTHQEPLNSPVALAPPASSTRTGSFCTGDADPGLQPSTDLYCIKLIATPDFRSASGAAELSRVPTPFGVFVSPDGTHRYKLTVLLQGLPEPGAVGPYSAYVAWVTSPAWSPMVNLGQVSNGRTELGEVALNKFLVLVTAEASADVQEREGRIMVRGMSPSIRMQATHIQMIPSGRPQAHHATGWIMPPMDPAMRMAMPGLEGLEPEATPFVPGAGISPASIRAVQPRETVALEDGDTLTLEATLVRRTIGDKTFTMYGYNGQHPGPLLRVKQDATVYVRFINHIDLPSTVHWHGVRIDNRFDGVPGVTQDRVEPVRTSCTRCTSGTPGSTGTMTTYGKTSRKTWAYTATCWWTRLDRIISVPPIEKR